MDTTVPKDDLKWFGEGFDGFPRHLPEDCIEYAIYIIDQKLNDSQARELLNAFQKNIISTVNKLLKDYIWQREKFNLELQREEDRWILKGRTKYGDSVADEWLIAYLLREASKQHPEAWIRIYDTDGEFLLIEAANALPKWLNPEIAENRVWLNNGRLLIVPRDVSGGKAPSIPEATSFISKRPKDLLHSPLLEEEAFYRLRNYPSDIRTSLHNALVRIPRKLAYIIHAKPEHISPAIEAFYLRDPIALKPLKSSDYSKLTFPPQDLITVSARFNRAGYAQVKSQVFDPPPAWEDVELEDPTEQTTNQAEVGMKLTCGFEMLVSDVQNRDKRAVREIDLLLEDLESGDEKLPTKEEILQWGGGQDDEKWMDINFEEFERELNGRKDRATGEAGKVPNVGEGEGFGDKAAQENLRKMVERFEQFLNDDEAGAEGAEGLEDMDYDDDEDEEDDSDEGEDKELSFDEVEFSRLMKEMMGMPAGQSKTGAALQQHGDGGRIAELDSDSDANDSADDEEAIGELSRRMEAELKTNGGLILNPKPPQDATAQKQIQSKATGDDTGEGEDEDEDSEINIDYNLAKNLLESLKSQAGMAGPAGNMMGLMGVQMPRDEGEEGKGGRA